MNIYIDIFTEFKSKNDKKSMKIRETQDDAMQVNIMYLHADPYNNANVDSRSTLKLSRPEQVTAVKVFQQIL